MKTGQRLSKPQKLIYDMEKFAEGSISVICGSLVCEGTQETEMMVEAVNKIFMLNDSLRIQIVETDEGTEQFIKAYEEKSIEVIQFKNKEELDVYAQKYAKIPIDLYGNLCEMKIVVLENSYGILVKLHHIVGDAWTLTLIANQFCQIINREEPIAYPYEDYLLKEEKFISGDRYIKDKEYFEEEYKKCGEITYLSDKTSNNLSSNRKTFKLDREAVERLNKYSKKTKASLYMVLMTAIGVYFNRVKMNCEKFYIGTPVLNRTGIRDRNTTGMFINTIPVLFELKNEATFIENLENVGRKLLGILRHQKCNYSDIISCLRKKYGLEGNLYDVLVSFQNAKLTTDMQCESTWYHCGTQTESLSIHIDDRESEGILRIQYDYQIEKFTEKQIESMHSHIFNLLFDAINFQEKKIYELEMLCEAEERKLMVEFNDTYADYPRDKCIHQLFEEQVERTPDKIAIWFGDISLTFQELNNRANALAHYLKAQGVKKNDIVPIILQRSWQYIVSMLAVLKAGAAYTPIDYKFPLERIMGILNDIQAEVAITYKYNEHIKTKQITLEKFNYKKNTNNIKNVNQPQDICYVLFTSGSTGKPKGVEISHTGVVNYCSYNENNIICHEMKKDGEHTIAAINNVCFDAFIDESLFPILNGWTMIMANDEESMNSKEFYELLLRNPIDVISTTPTKLKLLCEHDKYLNNIKYIILGGEEVTKNYLSDLHKQTKASIYNTYGPTETTVGCTAFKYVPGESVAIGKPISNTQIYIVDKHIRAVPVGVTGELCIAGVGVGAGYLNRPGLTAEKFIDNPFGEGKLYRTGDLAYWREDGNIVCVGRNDFQVKVRGLRIELGEIENVISSVKNISQAAVVVRKNNEERQIICAFYTGEEMDAKEIRRHIEKRLPKYMIPHVFTHLEEMPTTSSGKVDRKALPQIDLYNITDDTEYIAPVSKRQKELCKLVETILKTTSVGITDDFFEVGGDSLKAIEYVAKAHNEGIYFSVQNVFDYPTVKKLCEYIESNDKTELPIGNLDFTDINRILAKNTAEKIDIHKKENIGNILLAGATGYLGIHILLDYLENDEGVAYCLVRGEDDDNCRQRLESLLRFYFGEKYIPFPDNRIKVLCGDLRKENLGLEEREYISVSKNVDMVFNAAASVKHYGSYKYFYETNVETVRRLIRFCKESNAKLVHMSTLSVSGNAFVNDLDSRVREEEKHFYESSLYIGQNLDNVYVRSKFEAERLVLEAASEGLEAKVMRLGNLTNRYSDGKFQVNYLTNAFLKRLKSILDLGYLPKYLDEYKFEFTPVDQAAAAIMVIARNFNGEHTVFHINNPNLLVGHELFGYLDKVGINITVLNDEEFTQLLKQISKDDNKKHIFEAFINDIGYDYKINYDSNIYVENDFSVDYLKSLGFEWKKIDKDYLQKYVDYFKKIGYFEV